MRTALQCQATGCEGCVVCDRANYTMQELLEYREKESEIENLITNYFQGGENLVATKTQ